MLDVHMYCMIEDMLCISMFDSIVRTGRLMNVVFMKRFFPLMSF